MEYLRLRRDIHGLDISSIINHSSLPIGCMNILSQRSLTPAQPLRRLRSFTRSLASTMAGMLALNLIMCYTDRTIQHPDQSSCPAHLAQESRPYSIASSRPIPTNTASQSHVQPTLLLTYCPTDEPQSDTTRNPRGAEQNGVEYHFVSKDDFKALIDSNGFIEHATFGSNSYGTSFKAVEDIAQKGRICILDIEMEVCSPTSPSLGPARLL